jgi:hypothetical protein
MFQAMMDRQLVLVPVVRTAGSIQQSDLIGFFEVECVPAVSLASACLPCLPVRLVRQRSDISITGFVLGTWCLCFQSAIVIIKHDTTQ